MGLFLRGAEGRHAARRRRGFRGRAARGGLWDYLQVGVRARVLLWGVPLAASELQHPGVLVCRVKRRRPGACFAWGRGFRHCCVALPKSRGWGADFPWLVHVLWAGTGVGGGAQTLASQAGVCVLVWALGAPSVARVAWVARLRGMSEVRRSPPPGCPPLGGCPSPPPACCGRGCAGVGAPALSPWHACSAEGRVLLWWWGPSWGVAFHCCEGRPVSGAVPPPVPRPFGVGRPGSATRASRVRLVWAWGPSTGLTACAVTGRRCALRGWRKGVPPGGCRPPLRGASEFSPPPPPRLSMLRVGRPGPLPTCCGRGCAGVGDQHALSTWLACPVGGCVPRGCCRGWPSSFVRSVSRQALSLPWPPVLWGGQPGFRDPCVPGAVGVGVGTEHRSHSVRPCEPSLRAVGVKGGVPGGGAFCRCEGCLSSGAPPPPAACSLGGLPGPATHVPWARVCGRGGPALSPWLVCPVGTVPRGCWGRLRGGVAFHPCEGRLVSGVVPPPAARPLERAAVVRRPVYPGCGRCGRGDPAPIQQRAPLRAVVARCWGGGRASPEGCCSPL